MFKKRELIIGAEMSVDILYKNHHLIKRHFQDIIISIDDLDLEETIKVFKHFGAYNLYVKSPKYANIFNAKNSDTFGKTIQFYKSLLKVSGINLNGVIIDVGSFQGVSPEYANNIFKNIFLNKLILEYARSGKEIILRNTATNFNSSFSLSYILAIVRTMRKKNLVAGLDTEKSHYLNAGFLKTETKLQHLGRLKKDFKHVFLSGIGEKGKRMGIFECSVYPEQSYVNLIKGLNMSKFFIEYRNNLRELILDKDRIKMLAK